MADWTRLSEGDVRNILRKMIHRYAKPKVLQADIAKKLGVSTSFLSDVLHGRRAPTTRMLRAIGLERVVFYRRKHG